MRYAIGIAIGETTIACGILNQNGGMIQREILNSDTSDREKMFAQVITCVKKLLAHSSIPLGQISGIGAGIPGKVDYKNGTAILQDALPWENFPLEKRMAEVFQIDQIVIESDVDMIAFAEWKKADLREEDLFVYLTVDTIVSCSIIQAGKFIRGAGLAGELGLIPVYTSYANNTLERLEKVASGPAFEKYARERYKDDMITSKKIFQAFYDADPLAEQLIHEMAFSITQGIYTINSLLDPHKIVLGGSVAMQYPVLLKIIKNQLYDFLIEEQRHILDNFEIIDRSNDQAIIGAGLRVLEL